MKMVVKKTFASIISVIFLLNCFVFIDKPITAHALTSGQEELVEMVGKYAQQHYDEYKVLPSFVAAQALQESAVGVSSHSSGLSSLARLYHNYFGMKAGYGYTGSTVNLKTNEQTAAGEVYSVTDAFRTYTSFEEGMKGYYAFIYGNGGRYMNLVGETDYKVACQKVKEDGWATDIAYTQGLINKIENFNLTRFDVFDPTLITITGQTAPSGSIKKGSNFGIYGNLNSNMNITKVWGGIYKRGTDTAVQYVEDSPSAKSYSLHGKFNDNLIFDNLAIGDYTYKIYAKNLLKTYTLVTSDFSIVDTISSSITISGQTTPTGNLKLGGNFGIYGTISSNLNITKVWGGIYKQGTDTAVQYVEDTPNAKSYDLHGKFNNNLIFNNLSAGSYTYKIYATDSQKTYTLINSNFSVGTVDSYMSISGESIPSGSLTPGKFFAINGIIKSNLPITKVWGGVYKSDWTVTAQYAEATPNTTSYDLSKYFDSKIVFNGLAIGSYHYLIKATDTSGKEYTLINSDFQIGSVNNLEFNASTTTLDINRSKGLIKTITFSYKNAPVDRVSIQFVHGSNRITNCTWQEWSNQAIDLDFEGYKNGTEILTVNLLNAENDEVLASKMITINVTSDDRIVSFDANGGNCPTSSKTVTIGKEYGTLPTATKAGYTFGGWTLDSSSSSAISESTIVSKTTDHTLTAIWIPNSYIVSFDLNDGTGVISSKTVTYDKAIGDFPNISVRSDCEFLGWFTEPDGGDMVTPETKYTYETNIILYARVKENIIEPISTFELSNTDIILENGRQFHINATQEGLSYVSHNTDVAVVSRDGLITAVGEGVVIISVSNADGYEVLMIVTVIAVSDYTEGDVDGNGDFDIEDVKLLQRWLLADPDAHIKNWKAGDLCEDDRLDVFDLCLMKRLLLGG